MQLCSSLLEALTWLTMHGLCLQLSGSKYNLLSFQIYPPQPKYILPSSPLNLSINCCLLLKRAKATEASINTRWAPRIVGLKYLNFCFDIFDQTNMCSSPIDRHAWVNFPSGCYCAPNRDEHLDLWCKCWIKQGNKRFPFHLSLLVEANVLQYKIQNTITLLGLLMSALKFWIWRIKQLMFPSSKKYKIQSTKYKILLSLLMSALKFWICWMKERGPSGLSHMWIMLWRQVTFYNIIKHKIQTTKYS